LRWSGGDDETDECNLLREDERTRSDDGPGKLRSIQMRLSGTESTSIELTAVLDAAATDALTMRGPAPLTIERDAAGYRVPTVDLDEYEIEAAIIALVSRDLCESHRVIPVSRQGKSLIVAMVDPTDAMAIEALAAHTGMSVERLVVTDGVIFSAIERYYGAKR
jgi:hypothetical protein